MEKTELPTTILCSYLIIILFVYLQLIRSTPFELLWDFPSLDSWFKPNTAESPVPTLVKSAETGRYCFIRIEARLIFFDSVSYTVFQ